MSQPMGPTAPKSSRATTSLVLGILGFLCCQLCAPFAWYMGKQELAAIRAGTSPASGEGSAKAGMILGLIGTILLILTLVWVFGFGGLAVIQAMRGAQGS